MAKGIRITTRKDGFRRAGVEHRGTTVHPADRFTPDQVKALKAEPMLSVDEVDVPEAPAPAKKGG